MTAYFAIGATMALAAATVPLPASVARAQAIFRIYVETDKSGIPEELAARQDSVKDLKAALASKKKTIAIVESEDEAQIVVEVIDRGLTVPKVVLGLGPRPGQPPGPGGPVKHAQLRVRVTFKANERVVDLTNKNKARDDTRGWKSAADDLADQINKFVLNLR